MNDDDDVMLWPDGEWCYRFELCEMSHKSDDYQVLAFESGNWNDFMSKFP